MNTETWQAFIADVKTNTQTNEDLSSDEAVNMLVKEIPAALARSLENVPSPIGVLFSGGVDSTLLCFLLQKANIDFVAATVGFRDNIEQKLPDDIFSARESAEVYKWNHQEIIHNFLEIEPLFQELATTLGPNLANAVNMGVGSVELAGIKLLKQTNPNITHVMGGLGSEEIFAGYKRHSDATNIQEECWIGLNGLFDRDLARDQAIAKAENITWLTPFLDKELIHKAMTIPDTQKIVDGESKAVLRKAADVLGLATQFSHRPKQAAQYGSRTDSALGKIAKKNGFQYKKDYIASLLLSK